MNQGYSIPFTNDIEPMEGSKKCLRLNLQTNFPENEHSGVRRFWPDNRDIEVSKRGFLTWPRCVSLAPQESCLERLVQGLLKYKVLLRHVQTEYPTNPIVEPARFYGDLLASLLKNKVGVRFFLEGQLCWNPFICGS